ncbi:MAG: hypothetical protein KDC91_05750 [Flavobacteriaceae bacterium]|nr:hypothetical protein [Flavobacteriaceae bacterium]
MKNVTAIVLGLFAAVFSVNAASENTNHYYGNYNGQSYIFVEGGVEFSVFPDGQFDFVYVGHSQGSSVNVSINTPNVNISYNSGYNYDAFVQYDDYGAVIQVEEVPIYYDQFGRIVQAGSVEIRYTDRRIVRVGGLHVYYNNYGYFSHCTGYISPWYTTYVYRPWHVYYARPFYTHCVVYDYPYRRYYNPHRYAYTYHKNHYHRGHKYYTNGRRDFARVGSRVHYKDGRTAVNRDYNPSRRNTAVSYTDRDNKIGRNDYTNTRPSNSGNTTKGKPSNYSNSNTNSTSNSKGRPTTVSRGKPVTVNETSKGRPTTVTRGKPVTANESNKGRPTTVSKGKPATYSKPKVESSRPKVTNRSTNVQRNTKSNSRVSNNSRKTTTSSSKGTVQKRGRG